MISMTILTLPSPGDWDQRLFKLFHRWNRLRWFYGDLPSNALVSSFYSGFAGANELIGWTSCLKVEHNPFMVRYHSCGERTRQFLGCDPTGMALDEVIPDFILGPTLDAYALTVNGQRPVYQYVCLPGALGQINYHRLMLPFLNADGDVDTILMIGCPDNEALGSLEPLLAQDEFRQALALLSPEDRASFPARASSSRSSDLPVWLRQHLKRPLTGRLPHRLFGPGAQKRTLPIAVTRNGKPSHPGDQPD